MCLGIRSRNSESDTEFCQGFFVPTLQQVLDKLALGSVPLPLGFLTRRSDPVCEWNNVRAARAARRKGLSGARRRVVLASAVA